MNSDDRLLKIVKEMLKETIQTHVGYIRKDLERFDGNFKILFRKHDETLQQIAKLNAAKNNHEQRIGKLENKNRVNTFISGLFGFLGGVFWQASKWFWNK